MQKLLYVLCFSVFVSIKRKKIFCDYFPSPVKLLSYCYSCFQVLKERGVDNSAGKIDDLVHPTYRLVLQLVCLFLQLVGWN